MSKPPALTLTFLGTGTSMGIPVIGCDCPVCTSSDSRNRRTRASLHVASPATSLVIDTGPDFRFQCLRENIRRLDAAVYTHQHSDHIMGFDDLRQFCIGEHATLPIYGPPECLDQLRLAFSFAFDRANWYPAYVKPVPHPVTATFDVGDLRLTPVEVEHGKVRTFGYLLAREGRKLAAYLPDCKAVPPASVDLLRGVDTLIVDCLRHEPHWTHFSVMESLALKDLVQPRQTWLTHLSDRLEHATLETSMPPDVRVAYDGLKIALP